MVRDSVHIVLGPQLIPNKKSNEEDDFTILCQNQQKFPIVTSCRLMKISVSHILGEDWGVLGWILDIKGGTETNLKL